MDKSLFCVFRDREGVEVHKHVKNKWNPMYAEAITFKDYSQKIGT